MVGGWNHRPFEWDKVKIKELRWMWLCGCSLLSHCWAISDPGFSINATLSLSHTFFFPKSEIIPVWIYNKENHQRGLAASSRTPCTNAHVGDAHSTSQGGSCEWCWWLLTAVAFQTVGLKSSLRLEEEAWAMEHSVFHCTTQARAHRHCMTPKCWSLSYQYRHSGITLTMHI